jgi:hypothetical protein
MGSSSRARWRPEKRRGGQQAGGAGGSGAAGAKAAGVRAWLQQVFKIKTEGCCDAVFNMDAPGELERLAVVLWSGEYEAALAQLGVSNQALTFLLDELTTNTYNKNGKGLAERARRTAALQHLMVRMRSQKHMTLLCAMLSLEAENGRVPHRLRDALSFFVPHVLASHAWTLELKHVARRCTPPVDVARRRGLAVEVIDNVTFQINYKSLATTQASGYRLDMTVHIGITGWESKVPPELDAPTLCECAPRACALAQTHV